MRDPSSAWQSCSSPVPRTSFPYVCSGGVDCRYSRNAEWKQPERYSYLLSCPLLLPAVLCSESVRAWTAGALLHPNWRALLLQLLLEDMAHSTLSLYVYSVNGRGPLVATLSLALSVTLAARSSLQSTSHCRCGERRQYIRRGRTEGRRASGRAQRTHPLAFIPRLLAGRQSSSLPCPPAHGRLLSGFDTRFRFRLFFHSNKARNSSNSSSDGIRNEAEETMQ
jgi:hypothetical protein